MQLSRKTTNQIPTENKMAASKTFSPSLKKLIAAFLSKDMTILLHKDSFNNLEIQQMAAGRIDRLDNEPATIQQNGTCKSS